jgi:RNA polymerase sigma-70 factor (ECF subfamily)
MPAFDLPDFAASQLFLRRLAYRLVREEGLAEDLVQETWRTWLERAPAGLSEPRAWMAKVLRNLAFNAQRERARRAQRERASARTESVEPETDGALEAQAKLVDALRTLEEPYRSTLVQRYYHDLAPKEIAERGGVPLDTVKSRLARGLAKLREDLDRRYGGDRGAWCHWLWTLARPGAGVPTDVERGPGSRGAPAGKAAMLAGGAAGAKALLPGVAAGAVLLIGAVCVVLWNDGRGDGLRPGVVASPEPTRAAELVPARSERGAQAEVGPKVAVLLPEKEADGKRAAPAGPKFLFDWPQFGGNTFHDPRGLRRPGSIRMPKVAWHEPEARGSPTFLLGRCYAAGEFLLALDSLSGERLATSALDPGGFAGSPVLVSPNEDELDGALGYLRAKAAERDSAVRRTGEQLALARRKGVSESELERLATQFEQELAYELANPVFDSTLVLARRLTDGGITALDAELAEVVWEWRPSSAPRHTWPPCLAGERLLVPCDDVLFALDARTGKELWKVSTGVTRSAIEMVPACDERYAYFATEEGVVFRAWLESGGLQRWHETGGWCFGSHPVLFSTGLALVDRGSALIRPPVDLAPGEELWPGPNDRRGVVWSFGVGYLPEVLWQRPYEGTAPSTPGVGADGLLLGTRDQLLRIDFDGQLAEGRSFKTGSGPLATPAEHEGHVMAGTAAGTLELFDAETRQRLWTFRLPPGERVEEFVWAGPRVFVATTLGLFCLANDPAAPPDQLDFTLDWTGALALELERQRAAAGIGTR